MSFKKKLITLLVLAVALVAAVAMLTGCGTHEVDNVTIQIIGSDGAVMLEIPNVELESNNVRDILVANNALLQIPTAQLDSGFVSTIAGTTANWDCPCHWDATPCGNYDRYFWLFVINGYGAPMGIEQMNIQSGDVIGFILTRG